MTKVAYLTRAVLRRDVPAAALRELLLPDGSSERAMSTHRLMWTLFADSSERRRDFLWREAGPGRYYLLSARTPVDSHSLFEMDEPKPFAPVLSVGDRLRFSLRVNATVSRRPEGERQRGKPCDVVMNALWHPDAAHRARGEARTAFMHPAALAWLESRAKSGGFELPVPSDATDAQSGGDDQQRDALRVMGYDVWRLDRGRGRPPMRVGVLDLEGELIVRDPSALVARLVSGFGRARGFGCGLMLVRRAR